VRFPRGGGRVLGVHGPGSFHRLHGRAPIAHSLEQRRIQAQAARRGPDRVVAAQVASDDDLEARTGATAGLPGDLEYSPLVGTSAATVAVTQQRLRNKQKRKAEV
jgi:hypothetical protein